GSQWFAVGSTIDAGPVRALIADGTELYAGGEFTSIGGVTARSIARWNGFTWSALGISVDAGIDGRINTLTFHGGALHAGGFFSVSASHVSRWNGAAWQTVAS